MWRVLSNILCDLDCDLDPKVNVTGQKLYFLVNASTPQPLDVATSYFLHDIKGTERHLV